MEPETIALNLRDGWMISRQLVARRDVIRLYFETIELMAGDVTARPAWGVEIVLRGLDFTNEAFVALYECTERWHLHQQNTLEKALQKLDESPKLAVALLQSRAVLLRMLLFFCGTQHPLLRPLLDLISIFTLRHSLRITLEAAPMRRDARANIAWCQQQRRSLWVWPAMAADGRYIADAFYSIEPQFVQHILLKYLSHLSERTYMLSRGAHANHLIVQGDIAFNSLRANQQATLLARPEPVVRAIHTTALGSVLVGDTQLYTQPLAGQAWMPWGERLGQEAATRRSVIMCCGPQYVLKAEMRFGVDLNAQLRAFRFNVLGRIGALAADDTDSDPEQAMRATFEGTVTSRLNGLACGASHLVLWNSNNGGALFGCGSNERGQLGYGHYGGTTTKWDQFRGAPAAWVVSAGANHTLLLDNYGVMWGCGTNRLGQLGAGADVDELRVLAPLLPTAAGDRCVQVWAGAQHSVALLERGGLLVCGANESGQLGLGDRDNRLTWTPSGSVEALGDLIDVSCGAFFTALWTTRGFFVSGGAADSWTQLDWPTPPKRGGPHRSHIPLPNEKGAIEIDLTAAIDEPHCRYCRRPLSLEAGIQETRQPRLVYCDTTCQARLHGMIHFT